jgi:hypothetical protein|eukprot:COSAG06_NODE_1731_length_8560_cov_24.811488_1_plen_263_part_00
MGYVPLFCCACAGPVGHGYGLEGALEDSAAAAAAVAAPVGGVAAGADGAVAAADGAAAAAPAAGAAATTEPQQPWALSANELRWLEALRVLLPPSGDRAGSTSGVLEYEDYGVISTEDGEFVALNPIAWAEVDGSRPGVACHSDCLELLQRRLAALEPPVPPSEFAAAYHRAIGGHWKQHQEQPGGTEREALLLNCLLPGVNFGEGVLERCEQYYEFAPGAEWLVRSPKAPGEGGDSSDEAARNRERIEGAVSQLISQLLSV